MVQNSLLSYNNPYDSHHHFVLLKTKDKED